MVSTIKGGSNHPDISHIGIRVCRSASTQWACHHCVPDFSSDLGARELSVGRMCSNQMTSHLAARLSHEYTRVPRPLGISQTMDIVQVSQVNSKPALWGSPLPRSAVRKLVEDGGARSRPLSSFGVWCLQLCPQVPLKATLGISDIFPDKVLWSGLACGHEGHCVS